MPTGSEQRSLAQAFASFTHAAGSLEESYGQLYTEVVRLRGELEKTNRDLASSLEENQRMHAYLGRILEGLPCGVLVFGREGHLRIANPEARRLLAIAPNFSPESTEQLPEKLGLLLTEVPFDGLGSERAWSVESPQGLQHLAVTCARLPQGDASSGDSIFILRDTTEAKRLENEREAARRLQVLAEIAMLLAHEIRNPLGSLELFAGLLADATEDHAETRQWVDHLQAGLRTVSATVNNVLQFHSQPPLHSQPPPQFVPMNVVRLLRDTLDFLGPLARQRGMQIDFVNPPGEISIPGDPQRLQQVLFNLAINAFRSMSPGGRLKVCAGPAKQGLDGRAQIDFEDEGTGISPENLEKIFQPGFTTNPGSPGLGLVVCKNIVEQHGGTIRVRSIPGQGTTFSLDFPVTGATA